MHGTLMGILQSFGGLMKVYADLNISTEMSQLGRPY